MNIIDTYPDIITLFINQNFNMEIWRKCANSIVLKLADTIENDSHKYDFSKDILPIINSTINNNTKVHRLHLSFQKVTGQLQEKVINILGNDLDIDIILYLGLCNGAGWATEINGRKTILLGIEKIIELHWYDETSMETLIYHELGHIWHSTVRTASTEIVTARQQAIWDLYSEGVAMYCEQMLCNKEHFFHQDTNGWLEWCDNNRVFLISEYKQRILTDMSTKEFFGDWNNFMGYADVGYYLGAEFIRSLAKKYSLYEIANLDLDILSDELLLFS